MNARRIAVTVLAPLLITVLITVLAAASCTGSLCAQAQAQAPPASVAGIAGIAHVALRVSDLDQEEVFLGKLGFEESVVLVNGAGSARRMQVFMKINDRQFIELYSRNDPRQALGLIHISYQSDAIEGLDALYARRGLKPPPAVATQAHNLLFSLHDPEGRQSEFTQYMPDALQTLDKGKHLGKGRISDQLLGFVLPVTDLAVETRFYTSLGFEAQDGTRQYGNGQNGDGPDGNGLDGNGLEGDGTVRLSLPGNPDLRIELRPAHPGDQPQYLLAVPDAARAAAQLRRAGVKAHRQGTRLFVRDPDGNSFVLVQTGPRPFGRRRLMDAIPLIH